MTRCVAVCGADACSIPSSCVQMSLKLSTKMAFTSFWFASRRRSSAVVNDLFGIDLTSTLRSEESGEESTEAETVYKLGVHISSEVNYVHEGIKHVGCTFLVCFYKTKARRH